MTPAARLSAAIELIETIDAQRVPAAKALKEWGTAHRYAGSGDRAAISGLIWDVLRRQASSAWLMDADTPRARVLGMVRVERGMNTEAISPLCDGGRFAPAAPAARRWGVPRGCKAKDASSPPSTTGGSARRATSGSPTPASTAPMSARPRATLIH